MYVDLDSRRDIRLTQMLINLEEKKTIEIRKKKKKALMRENLRDAWCLRSWQEGGYCNGLNYFN